MIQKRIVIIGLLSIVPIEAIGKKVSKPIDGVVLKDPAPKTSLLNRLSGAFSGSPKKQAQQPVAKQYVPKTGKSTFGDAQVGDEVASLAVGERGGKAVKSSTQQSGLDVQEIKERVRAIEQLAYDNSTSKKNRSKAISTYVTAVDKLLTNRNDVLTPAEKEKITKLLDKAEKTAAPTLTMRVTHRAQKAVGYKRKSRTDSLLLDDATVATVEKNPLLAGDLNKEFAKRKAPKNSSADESAIQHENALPESTNAQPDVSNDFSKINDKLKAGFSTAKSKPTPNPKPDNLIRLAKKKEKPSIAPKPGKNTQSSQQATNSNANEQTFSQATSGSGDAS